MVEQGERINDYDRIAKAIVKALAALIGNAHEPPAGDNSNSITMTKDGFITGVIRLQRLRGWVDGLAEAHRSTGPALADTDLIRRTA